MTSDAELRSLLLDCLKLWDIDGRVTAAEYGLRVEAAGQVCLVRRGAGVTRWMITAGGRTRPVPSVVALLSALRRALGVAPGVRARVGAGAEPA